jgi:hypothetical protein
MLEMLLTILFEVVITYLIIGPGAIMLWLISGRKKPLKIWINHNQDSCFLVGLVIWCSPLVILTGLKGTLL